MIEPFQRRYERALKDDTLRHTLLAFQRNWRANRDRAVATMDFEAERERLAAAKDEVIAGLPAYVEEFRAAAHATGARTVTAANGGDAARYIARLAREHEARKIVKSKSMTSEEIDLNHSLEAAGLEVVETDLGEWIVQLAGERPSHIVGPALHKNRRQVAELLSMATGKRVNSESIAEQVATARESMRGHFLSGHIGISGANALIAETGTIVLVTNEGNAELVTSLPPVHVVVVGMEKLIRTVEDAMLELSLLAPSATGQPATSYVTFITGPSTPDRELHIVLLDNGRSAMRADPNFADALRCIRCGACSSVCPSYGAVGGHVFGYVYSGAIGLVNTPFHHGLEHDAGPQSLCVSCNACQEVCPVDIPLPRQILDTRAKVAEEMGVPAAVRFGIELWSRPPAFRLAARMGGLAQIPVRRGAFLEPPLTHALTDWRKPPALATRPFRDRWMTHDGRPLPGALGKRLGGMRIAYFVQCLTDWLYPEMGLALVDVLRSLGAEVVFPKQQHCCGLPAIDAGLRQPARRMARQTIRTLEAVEADYIVSGGTSCVAAMVHEYPHLFAGDPEWQFRAERLAARVIDFTRFMNGVARLEPGSLDTGEQRPAVYHYFCQSYNVLHFRDEPHDLLQGVCGYDLRPLTEANVCCGFGGSVSAQRPEMCRHILDRKLTNVEAAGAPLLVTDNPGCIMHLRGGIAARGGSVRVQHTAEIVAQSLASIGSRSH